MPDPFDWFVHPAVRGDAQRAARLRAAAKALLSIAAVVSVLLVGFLFTRGAPSGTERALFACAILTPVLAAVALRFTWRIVPVLVLTNLAGILIVALWSYATGGILSAAAPWLLALLAVLGTFGNARVLLLAFAADLGVLVLLYAATVAGRLPPSVVPAGAAPMQMLLALVSSVSVVAFAAALVLRERARARALLRRSAEELERLVAQRTAELRERESLLKLVTENVPVQMAYFDADGVCRFANERYAAGLGRALGEVIGAHASKLLSAEGYAVASACAARASAGEIVRFERPLRADPSRTVEIMLVPDLSVHGRLRGAFAALVDITQHRLAERELQATAEQLRLVAESIPAMVVHFDRNLVCRYANMCYAQSIGWERDALLGRHIGEILGEEYARDPHGRSRRALAGETVHYERERSGRTFAATLAPYRGPDGVQDGYFGFAVDVTGQKQVEHDLRESEERLRRLNAELEQRVVARTAELEAFAYSISHDLRAPARAVAGFSQMLIEDFGHQLEPGAHRLLGKVAAAGRTMGEMIDGLLGLSRIGRVELHREAVDLSRLAAEVWAEVSMAERDRSVRFELQEGVRVEGDPVLLRTLLQNLLGNAYKYTRNVPAAVVAFGQGARDGRLACFVRDNGVGFDLQYAGKLFGAFQRLHSASEFEGTGIGLATVRRIVERHGGEIWAESAPGEGATFCFTLGTQSAIS